MLKRNCVVGLPLVCPQSGSAGDEVALLGEARSQLRGFPVLLERAIDVTRHLQEVAANGDRAVVIGHRAVHFVQHGEAGRGPFAIAAATARLTVTTGLPVMRSSSPYRERICGQSVSAAVGARSWIDAIAAWIWYSPTGPARSRSREGPCPPRSDRVPTAPVLFGERDEVALAVRAGRSPGVDQEHEGQEARDLCVVGEVAADHPREPDGFDRELDALEFVARAAA